VTPDRYATYVRLRNAAMREHGYGIMPVRYGAAMSAGIVVIGDTMRFEYRSPDGKKMLSQSGTITPE
jgi:hypothetical protein